MLVNVSSICLVHQVSGRKRPGDLPRHWGQAGHHLSQGGPRQRVRVLQAVPGEEGAGGELQHSPRPQCPGQLQQAREGHQVHHQIPGVQPQLHGPGVQEERELLHHL